MGLAKTKYATIETEFRTFKIFYVKKLLTVYSDSYKRHMAKHVEEKIWDKLLEIEHKVMELEERHEYLTVM